MFGGQVKCPWWSAPPSVPAWAPPPSTPSAWRPGSATSPASRRHAPATPADAKGLLISAIRDDNPVVFLEHKMLYASKGEVPEGDYTIPIGKADVKREGADVTLVCYSAMVRQCLAAAEDLGRKASAPRCSTCARSYPWTRRRS